MKNSKLIYLYLDDVRHCPKEIQDAYVVMTARDSYRAIDVIDFCVSDNVEMYIYFDHDLGEGKSGYDVAKYIVENQIPVAGYCVHSMNPVGAWNIHQLMGHYGYGRFEV
jgi:hypothetical protein